MSTRAFEHVPISGGLTTGNLKAYKTLNAVSAYISGQGESLKKQAEHAARENARENTVDKETSQVVRKTALYTAPVLIATVNSTMAVENYKHAMQRNFDAVSNLGDNASKLSQKLEEAGMVKNPDVKLNGSTIDPAILSGGAQTYSSMGRMTQFNNGYTVTQIDMQGFASEKKFSLGYHDDEGNWHKCAKVSVDTSGKDFVSIMSVDNKGNIIETKGLSLDRQKEIANNLKDYKGKNVWGKFEPSSLGKNRDAFHYRVQGTSLQVVNMNGEARAVAEMYQNLLRYNRKKGGNFLDKELEKQVKELKDAAKNLDKAKRQLSGVPKRLGGSVARVATSELEQSEAMKGFRLGNSLARGTGVVIKAGKPIAAGASRFAIDNAYKGVTKVGNAILKKMGKDFRIPVLKNGLTGFIRQKIVNLRKFNRVRVGRLIQISPLGNTIVGKRLQNRMIFSIAKLEGLDKALAKEGLKAANKALGKSVIGKGVQKVANKAASTAVGKVVGKVGKVATGAIKGVTNVVLAPFKFMARAMNALKRAIGKVLITVFKFVIIPWAALLLLEMGFGVLAGMFAQQDDIDNYNDMYTASTIEEWNTKSQTIIDTLHSCHEDELDTLSEMQQKYEVADIQYPSGEKENYKELFCAILVTCQYDISIFPSDDLKTIAKELYERTHIVMETPYNISNYDGTVSENNACHIYLNVQRGTSLAYAILDQSAMTEDLSNIVSGECDSEDWLNTVQTVKSLMAASAHTGAAGDYYYDSGNTGATTYINVNGTNYFVRQDCSGFVSVCLQVYGSFAHGQSWASSGFVSATSIQGFTKMRFSGWSSCHIGDILAVYGNGEHHVEIFAGIFNGTAYVYNAGSSNAVKAPGATVAGGHNFTTIWRPLAAGSIEGTDISAGDDESGYATSASGILNDVTINDYEPGDETWPYGYWVDEDDINLPFSNTAGVTFNEETQNEDGYEDALKATVQATIDSNSYFTSGAWVSGTDAHILKKGTSTAYGSATTAATSLDFVRYIYAKHSVQIPMDAETFFEEMDQTTLSDLKVGDIVVYVRHTTDTDKISAVKAISDLNGGEPEVEGVDNVTETIYNASVPLIYIGDNQFVGYGPDVLLDATSGSTTYVTKTIKTYDLSDLDEDQIYEVIRPYGFTINATYGSTEYFEGWTNMNIARLYVFMNDPCWTTGSKVIEPNTLEDKNEDVETDEDGMYTVDYSFYDEKYDMFSGNDIYYSSDHTDTFMDDMINELIANYSWSSKSASGWGILPSIGYTKAYVLSNNRTTPESLKHYNVFEQLETTRYLEKDVEDIYTYDGEGDATISSKSYRQYDSLYEAISELYAKIPKNILFINDKSTNPQSSFNLDLMNWKSNDLITADEQTKMKERYNEVAEKLQEADKTAIRIKELEDLLLDVEDELNAIANESESNFHENNNGGRGYSTSANTVDNAISYYNELAQIINDYATNNPGYTIYTPTRRAFMERLNTAITNAENQLNAAYDYHSNHSGDHMYCYKEEEVPDYDSEWSEAIQDFVQVQTGSHIEHYYESWSKRTFTSLTANTSSELVTNKVEKDE